MVTEAASTDAPFLEIWFEEMLQRCRASALPLIITAEVIVLRVTAREPAAAMAVSEQDSRRDAFIAEARDDLLRTRQSESIVVLRLHVILLKREPCNGAHVRDIAVLQYILSRS